MSQLKVKVPSCVDKLDWLPEKERYWLVLFNVHRGTGQLKCDGTHAETRYRLSAERTSPFKSAGRGVSSVDCWPAEVCASAVVMLDIPYSEVVWRVLATHSIRQFPLHFPFHASPCAITFEPDCTYFTTGKYDPLAALLAGCRKLAFPSKPF